MSRTSKIALGIATLWPIAYMLLFLGFMLYMVLFSLRATQGSLPPSGLPAGIATIFVLHLLTILWIWVLIGIYIVHLFKTDRVPKDQKALWAVVLFLGNMYAMPVYWYLYIWREPDPDDAGSEGLQPTSAAT
jgi:hypothetical protein